MKFEIKQIGIIHTPYKTKEECPIQGNARPEGRGSVKVFDEYAEALETIETFSHIMLFYMLDRSGEVKLSRPTFLDDVSHGVFSSRHPCRPNGIGFSIVRLEERNGNILKVSGIDMLNNTPLIDIKPYVPKFDCFVDASDGWIEEKEFRPKPEGRE